MGLNSGKIRDETARLHVKTRERRKSTGINRITVRIAIGASCKPKYVEMSRSLFIQLNAQLNISKTMLKFT
jgi:hypothetical protein